VCVCVCVCMCVWWSEDIVCSSIKTASQPHIRTVNVDGCDSGM